MSPDYATLMAAALRGEPVPELPEPVMLPAALQPLALPIGHLTLPEAAIAAPGPSWQALEALPSGPDAAAWDLDQFARELGVMPADPDATESEGGTPD